MIAFDEYQDCELRHVTNNSFMNIIQMINCITKMHITTRINSTIIGTLTE